MMKIKRTNKRHSFELESNGYRLVFEERESQYKNQPYFHYFGIVSFTPDGEYAHFGIGKWDRNNSTSFQDAIEKQMLALDEKRESTIKEIEELKRRIEALNEFQMGLSKIFLEDGVDTQKEEEKETTK